MSFEVLRFRSMRLLLLLVALLAAGLSSMWIDENAHLRGVAWHAPKALSPDIKLPVGPPRGGSGASDASLYAAVLERPLFAPDRRPPPPPAPPAPPAPPDPLADIQIHGIFVGANAGILARVDGKSRRIKLDEKIGPWMLKRIDGRDVTFTQGQESRKVRLAYARLDAPVPPAAKPSAQPASASAAPPRGAPGAAGAVNLPQKVQDEVRERLMRRNALRASRGMPLLTE